MNRFFTTAIVILSVNLAGRADTIDVYSGESIQAAIDSAVADDVVLVHPGIYFGCLNLSGKDITLKSTDGPEETIVSGLSHGSVITAEIVVGAWGPKAIDGFTLCGGTGTGTSYCSGGGIYLYNTAPTIRNCILLGNTCLGTVTGRGGGVYCVGGGSPTIVNCIFTANRVTDGSGGAIYTSGGSPTVVNCTFVGNSVTGDSGQGGAIYLSGAGSPKVVNSILWSNTAADGPQLYVSDNCSASVTYNCVEGGWTGTGNIATDPRFVDIDGADDMPLSGDEDLHLRSNSRCIDAGSVAAIPAGVTTDYEGDVRIQQGGVDIGVDETSYSGDCNGNGFLDAIEMGPLDGNALWFDGLGDYVDPGASTALAELGQGDFTIEAWVWTEDTGHSILIGNAGGASRLYNFVIRGNEYGGVIALRIKDGVSELSCLGETSVTDGRWHHVAAVRLMTASGWLIMLFVDGDLDGSGWPDAGPFTADNETLIGRDQQSSPHYFNGLLDELRVWSVGRDETEIAADMYSTLEGTETGLVAYWRFDEGEGSVAYDSAGDSDGTLVGSTSWVRFSEDCNDNGIPDECDIADGFSLDCNENGVPDMCDLSDGTSQDCNENSVPDICDIQEGTSQDCNTNGVPDECDLGDGTSQDCNTNGVPDKCDLRDGTSQDCNASGVPDECEAGGTEDCNTNGSSDLCDIYEGTSLDCNGTDIPDECEVVPTGVLYVDDDATDGLNDGSSWANAYLDLQDALGYAECSGRIGEIRVAGGTYKPGTSRDDSFFLLNGVALRGGYRGLAGGGDPNDRDRAAFESILSGDIGVIDDTSDNCWRVVYGLYVDESAVIEGFTITQAFNIDVNVYSGGVCLDHAGPTIAQCMIRSNRSYRGGGIYCRVSCNPTLINCVITGNWSTKEGSAMYNYQHNSPTLINCTIVGNSSDGNYRGIHSFLDTDLSLTNCILWDNKFAGITGDEATVAYCCIQGGYWSGIGNIDNNPLLDEESVHLLEGSPCINAGNDAAIPAGVTTDFDGEDRIQHCRVDIGADESPYFNKDCNTNGVADLCEVGGTEDCNENGESDLCDIYEGTSQDYNENDIPDDCEVGGTEDCNENGIPDLRDIIGGTSPDYNVNGVPDECESGITEDCNSNGSPDLHDIYDGISVDCNDNEIPDECEVGGTEDCNGNGSSDLCDIHEGTSVDCNGTDIPDECEAVPTDVIHVDDDATDGLNDGSSWANAFLDVQDALAYAECRGRLTEIRVAGGTYMPGTSRDDSFGLLNGVSMRGGYRGLAGGGNPDDRDFDAFVSILSGDVGVIGDTSDNSEILVNGSNTDASAVIEGFTITGAYATEEGSAVYIDTGSPTIAYCKICSNNAQYGGGMRLYEGSPTISHCAISNNRAVEAHGGGIYGFNACEPTLINCTISGNVASQYGGGIYMGHASHPTLTGCTFRDNSSGSAAGVCVAVWSSGNLNNCTFSGNRASLDGGGFICLDSTSSLTNCTFTGNDASDNGGGLFAKYSGNVSLTNCIFWGNTASTGQQMGKDSTSSLTVSHSCVNGGWAGVGNIDTDPLLADADGPDDVFGTEDDDAHLLPDSPCVNAGDDAAIPSGVTSDFEGEDRIQQCRVDMGADESPYFGNDCNGNGVSDECDLANCSGNAWCGDCNDNGVPDECDIASGESEDANGDGLPDECPLYGDCDDDGDVDLDDYSEMMSCMLGPDADSGVDCDCFDGDGDLDVDLKDFALFQQAFTGPGL